MKGPSSRARSASAVFLLAGSVSISASAGPPPSGPLRGGATTPTGALGVQKPDPSTMAAEAAKAAGPPSYTLTAYVKNEKLPPVPWPTNTSLLPPGTMQKTSVPTAALAAVAGNQAAGQTAQTAQAATSPTDPPAAWVGTKGSGTGVEAFSVSLGTPWPSCLALEYMAHVPGLGDTGWFQAPARIGTVGSSKFVEGVAFRLAGSCADQYALKYNCHLQGLGDQTMMSSPAFCGTRGQGRPLEAFVVYVTPAPAAISQTKPTSTPGTSTVDFLVAKLDFAMGPDQWLGTKGQGIQLTSLAVKPALTSLATPWPSCLTLKYMGHVSGVGDTGWYDAPSFIQGGLEGVAFKLEGACASSYVVEYQCHVQGIGDVPLMQGPSFCGTRGQSRRLEAVRVSVRKR
jgi:hypothetical protein